MANHPSGGGLAEVLPFPARLPDSNGEQEFCSCCNDVRLVWFTGRCSTCGQIVGVRPGDQCTVCGGEGVVDGLIVGDGPAGAERCGGCSGTGRVPA